MWGEFVINVSKVASSIMSVFVKKAVIKVVLGVDVREFPCGHLVCIKKIYVDVFVYVLRGERAPP